MSENPENQTCENCDYFLRHYTLFQSDYIATAIGHCPMRRCKAVRENTPACKKFKRRMLMDCIFCKIAAGEIPSKKLYEDRDIYAFYDIDPKAPTHFLVIPKEHIQSAAEINASNMAVVGKIYAVIAKLSAELGLEDGYRVVTNCGTDGGQTVAHLHFHVLAGRSLAWPPG